MIAQLLQRKWLAVIAVAAIQSLVLGWMVFDRVVLLRTGKEVVLDVVPVDPRSLFRGDYVILGYDISSVEGRLLSGAIDSGQVLYVTIAMDADAKWKPVAISPAWPAKIEPGQMVLKARSETTVANATSPPAIIRVRYGIESYFVPEGTGRVLETQVRDRRIAALVAVDRSGNSAIKGLKVDGQTIYEEAPF